MSRILLYSFIICFIRNCQQTKLFSICVDKRKRILRRKTLDPVKNLSKYESIDNEHNAVLNGLKHVYSPEKLDEPQFVCNIEYFYACLLNLRTTCPRYELKSAIESVRHQVTSLRLSAASESRETAESFQKVSQHELKQIIVENRKTFGIRRSLARNQSIIVSRSNGGLVLVTIDR